MNEVKLRKISLGQLGLVNLDLNIITLGSGGRKLVILCGVHGDERSGLFIVNDLISELRLLPDINGSVNIVLGANPLAQALCRRESPNDSFDLNRVFPGNIETDFTKRLAAKIIDLCTEAELVIDLHTFQDISPVVAIFMNSGTEKIRSETLSVLRQFNPEVVWKLDFNSTEEAALSGALGPILATRGIVNFAVETPESFHITQHQINRVVEGILRVLRFKGFIAQESPNNTCPVSHTLNIFTRVRVRTDTTGLFIPDKEVLSEVKKSDTIGSFVSLPSFIRTDVKSPCDGTLLVVHQRNLVSTSDEIASIGIKNISNL